MQVLAHQSLSRPCSDFAHSTCNFSAYRSPFSADRARQQLFVARAVNAHLEPTAASAGSSLQNPSSSASPAPSRSHLDFASRGSRSRYLTYAEYVELQAQQQQQAAVSSDQSAHADTAQQSPDAEPAATPKKRIPWNKGRKHSALTIAKIRETSIAASQRPEARAKYEAWNQSRVGVPLPEHHRANIKKAAGAKSRVALTPEQQANKSARAKALWQDPEYAAKTLAALRAAASNHKRVKTAEGQDGDSSSSAARPRRRLRKSSVVDEEGVQAEQGQPRRQQRQQPQQQREPKPPRQKKPTQRELAAAAAEQQQQLQQQVMRLLQTQQLIRTTEQTVQQLQANLAAFENNPQSYAVASQTMQRAQGHLEQARAQVQQLRQHLEEFEVQWDSQTGQITHIAKGLAAQLQQQKDAANEARKAKRAAAAAASSSSSTDEGVVPSSRRGKPPGRGGSSGGSSSSRGGGGMPPSLPSDVVPSQRRASAPDSRGTVSTRRAGSIRSPASAAAEAAVAGGSKVNGTGASNAESWSVVGSQMNGTSSISSSNGVNGHRSLGVNGNSNGHKSDDGTYVTVNLRGPNVEDL